MSKPVKIPIPAKINKIAIILLKIPFGLTAYLSFLTKVRPNSPTLNITKLSPKNISQNINQTTTKIFPKNCSQNKNISRTTEEKTGPKAAPVKTAPNKPSFLLAVYNNLSD